MSNQHRFFDFTNFLMAQLRQTPTLQSKLKISKKSPRPAKVAPHLQQGISTAFLSRSAQTGHVRSGGGGPRPDSISNIHLCNVSVSDLSRPRKFVRMTVKIFSLVKTSQAGLLGMSSLHTHPPSSRSPIDYANVGYTFSYDVFPFDLS